MFQQQTLLALNRAKLGDKPGESQALHGKEEKCLANDEHNEDSMVPLANTVVDPGTVMVKAVNALVAHGAVPTPRWYYYLTLSAEIQGVELLQDLHERYLRVFLDNPRLDQPTQEAEHDCCRKRRINKDLRPLVIHLSCEWKRDRVKSYEADSHQDHVQVHRFARTLLLSRALYNFVFACAASGLDHITNYGA